MEPLRRRVDLHTEIRSDGTMVSIGRTDDFFHGFEVTLEIEGNQVISAGATSHRHPWTTCPGALASVASLAGPLAGARRRMLDAPTDTTCVHVNDLVGLAAECHPRRVYEIESDPTYLWLERDGERLFDLRLDGWLIADGPLAGMGLNHPAWRKWLDDQGADDDLREAVLMLRRGLLVAIGVFVLDWSKVSHGHHIEYGVMTGTCHTFSEPQLSVAVSLVDPPT